MQDLNDLFYFVQVVDHQGFAAAARALGLQKSKLSRRVAMLEERVGVRLIQRSTRRFSVTEVGQEYYRQCKLMLTEAEGAQAIIDSVRATPSGLIRMACPPGLLAYRFAESIASFLAAYPDVMIRVKALNRPVDVIGEGYDLVIRNTDEELETSALMTRKLGEVSQCLVASPSLLAGGSGIMAPTELTQLPSLHFGQANGDHLEHEQVWHLEHEDGAHARVVLTPRLVSDDLSVLHAAAIAGTGIALLPSLLIENDIEEGRLVEALTGWRPANTGVHAVFPSRRGLLPSMRALLDHLADECTPYRDGTLPQR